ncbi:hypothetical protein ACPCSP_25430 [Streptomyces cinereoruber]|uniref:hypothetical protein n=1 Tax=Streptomyces cinereoruber TaxID=67260 RepID=UPI003C2EF89A
MADLTDDTEEPYIHLTSETEQPCPECGKQAFGIVTVYLDPGDGTKGKVIGGWALCGNCHHAPHPVMDRGSDG